MSWVKDLQYYFLNLIFPPRCAGCDEILDYYKGPKDFFCEKCIKEISFISPNACKYCGKQRTENQECNCVNLLKQIFYSRVISSCEYDGLIRDKMLDFKFKSKKELAKVLGGLVIEKITMTNLEDFDIIVSVPMHEVLQKQRGYNQSELIAEQIAKHFKKPLLKGALIKNKITVSQTKLSRDERIENSKDAYDVIKPEQIMNKKVLLIDDIITTGSTVNECSRKLVNAGAKEVMIATVATGKSDVNNL